MIFDDEPLGDDQVIVIESNLSNPIVNIDGENVQNYLDNIIPAARQKWFDSKVSMEYPDCLVTPFY